MDTMLTVIYCQSSEDDTTGLLKTVSAHQCYTWHQVLKIQWGNFHSIAERFGILQHRYKKAVFGILSQSCGGLFESNKMPCQGSMVTKGVALSIVKGPCLWSLHVQVTCNVHMTLWKRGFGFERHFPFVGGGKNGWKPKGGRVGTIVISVLSSILFQIVTPVDSSRCHQDPSDWNMRLGLTTLTKWPLLISVPCVQSRSLLHCSNQTSDSHTKKTCTPSYVIARNVAFLWSPRDKGPNVIWILSEFTKIWLHCNRFLQALWYLIKPSSVWVSGIVSIVLLHLLTLMCVHVSITSKAHSNM